jgi:TolB protein
MLLRAYRFTDKMSSATLKIAVAMSDWLLDRSQALVFIGRRSSWGVSSLLFAFIVSVLNVIRQVLAFVGNLLLMLLAGLWWLVSRFAGGIRTILQMLWRFFGMGLRRGGDVTNQVAQTGRKTTTRVARNTQSAASDAMARRAARAEIDAQIVEDPLRIQNRRLSFLVLILGVLVIGVLLYATDPNRSTTTPINADANRPASNLFIDETAVPTEIGFAAPLASPIPTATRVPTALQFGGSIAYTVRERGQTDIWALNVGSRDAIRLTNDIADERDPVWSPDGNRLAYASRKDGNWEIYIDDLTAQTSQRLTFDLSFQANPSWSPDGLWLAYESYQGQNLDIYAVPIDGSETPIRITDDSAPDFAPAWSPSGREIAFVSWRDGNQDVYVFNLDNFELYNLTQSPNRNEDHPAWSPDGRLLAFSALDQGAEKVFVVPSDSVGASPEVISFGRTPSWSPDGASLTFTVDALDGSTAYLYAVPYGRERAAATEVIEVPFGSASPSWSSQLLPPALVNAEGLDLAVVEPLYIEQAETYQTGAPYRLNSLLDVETDRPFLSDRVNDSFNALRQNIFESTGIDFLQELDDAWWDLERLPEQGQPRRNWHMTGRAFAMSRSALLGFPPQIEIVREDLGVETYWRVFVRVDEESQNGQLGEPLRQLPWDFLSRNQGDVEAYNQGGRLRQQVPAGYYVDFTLRASDYGWQRLPANTDWRANVNGINYAMYIKPEGLDWYNAMLEIHTPGELINFAPTPTPAPIAADDGDDNTDGNE